MSAGGYESWFVSARDPGSRRALWIRHTRHRPAQVPPSAALWCTVVDHDADQPPAVVKQVFGAFPPDAVAGPGQFRGQAALGPHTARWDLAITGGQPPLRPLRPPALYRAPLPRTKLEATVPDGQVTGRLEIDGREVAVSGWRGTVAHAALAALELTVHRLGRPALTLSSRRGGYEYGASQPVPGLAPRALPEG